MKVGFCVQSRNRQVEVRILGRLPADRPALVTFARQGDCCVVLMGRLHYRDELLSQLSKSPGLSPSSSDTELVLGAYRQWGIKGIARLEGDFSLVVWDGKKDLLVGSRDPLGGFPLYWTKNNGEIVFSTSLRPLLAVLPRRRVNLNYLAEYLTVAAPTMQEVPSEECVYEGIHRVGPGTMVQVQMAAGHVSRHVYWDWMERMVDPQTAQLEEIGEQVSDRLRQAVGQRVCGRTASHFSGGMDSTAVALIARDWLDRGRGQPPLHALSVVYDRHPNLAREKSYIEDALEHRPGIAAHRIPGDDFVYYDSFIDPPPQDEPYPGLLCLGVNRAIVEAARE